MVNYGRLQFISSRNIIFINKLREERLVPDDSDLTAVLSTLSPKLLRFTRPVGHLLYTLNDTFIYCRLQRVLIFVTEQGIATLLVRFKGQFVETRPTPRQPYTGAYSTNHHLSLLG